MDLNFKRQDKHTITGGCSFTNCAKSWPYHIDQEKYGWVHNVATPGAGQAFISRSVIYEIEEMIGNGIRTEDMEVFVMWSGIDRYEILSTEKETSFIPSPCFSICCPIGVPDTKGELSTNCT